MRLSVVLLLSASILAPAFAQEVPAPAAAPAAPAAAVPAPSADEEESMDDEIVVTASRRNLGAVVGDITPEVTLNAADIRAYGVSNLGELLEELSPQTGSVQGRGGEAPVVLLGGRRISSFREIRDLPPEAVVRVEILPEEVALKYGYRADQKVVNFILRQRFQAITTEVETLQATAGGRQGYEADINYLRLAPGSRLSLDAEYERLTPLFESERNVIEADPDRTLLSSSDALKLNGTYNRTILGNVSATISAELEGADTTAALGRAADGSQRLLRDGETRNANVNYALNGNINKWRWSLDGGYTRNQSTILTDRDTVTGVGRDRARSVATTLSSVATLGGDLLTLPAGFVSLTLKAGFDLRDIASESTRAGVFTATDLSRDQGNAQANLDVPLLEDSAVGNLSVNLNGQLEQLSDFGTLTTLGYGFTWKPVDAVQLIGSITEEDGAPSIQQLGDPVLVTPNVRVFDVVTGQTVDVTRIEGGNPNLLADSRRVMKLGLTVKPIKGSDLSVLATYTDTRIDNPTASLPSPTPEIEAAFPDRFERDNAGNLFRIDSRPLNFERSKQRSLRWGLNWSKALAGPPPVGPDGKPLTAEQIEERRAARRDERQGARGAGGPGGERGGRGGGPGGFGGPGGGGGGGFGGGRGGRITLALFHTWRLEDTILIREGVPELDLLDGSATGSRGGQSRHSVELRAGINKNGLGARVNADWNSATRITANRSTGQASAQDLRFGALTTVNLRLFADLGQQRKLVTAVPFLRRSRVTLAFDNIFDQRLDVRDTAGLVPIGYQPDLLDPLGRSVRVSFRKLF
ncbi:TonB-dependent receptor [Glacieibacterium frigidum]|uniref:TonB-dependent receptor n=1 Tax=Glacieibacterium frigidum TaxID=2593303 RepID=A0A552UAD3_9SPHN|nr:TonB-dependent receptor [Glacieibacterium frigidum]TRW15177.1 TonB-dependent receptor [Glacieibacterium frigidum]